VDLAHAIIATGGEASTALPANANGVVETDPRAQWCAVHALASGYAAPDIAQSAPSVVEGLRRSLSE
jgi:hypothetical protein